MKIISKIHQKSIKNQWKWGPWGRPGTTLGVFGLMLVESDEFWRHFGWIFFTFSLQDGFKMPSRWDPGAFWGPSWGPKSIKIAFKSDQKYYYFCDRFEDRFWKRFGADLAPIWLLKPSQNGAKLVSKSILFETLIAELFFEGCWLDFECFLLCMLLGRHTKIIKFPCVFVGFCYMRQRVNISCRCFEVVQQGDKKVLNFH